MSAFGGGGQFSFEHGAQPRGGSRRFVVADGAAHFLQTRGKQVLRVEGRLAREQLVEQHAQAVDVRPRINIQAAHPGLLRTHISGRPNELLERGEQGLVRQPLVGRRLGDAKINHLRHRHSVMVRDQDVRGLDVAMNDAFLVGVLNSLGNLDEQIEPLRGGKISLVAVVSNLDPAHQLHDEVRAARVRRAGLQNLGDIRMIH